MLATDTGMDCGTGHTLQAGGERSNNMGMTEREAMENIGDIKNLLRTILAPPIADAADKTLDMAIAALTAQVPRVLEQWEEQDYFTNDDNPPVLYAEYRCDPNGWITGKAYFGCIARMYRSHGKDWRLWSHKPTAEQMAAEPWKREYSEQEQRDLRNDKFDYLDKLDEADAKAAKNAYWKSGEVI
jgi:hypothetical protein